MNDRKKADAEFDAHFDRCDECKRGFQFNRMDMLCVAGDELYEASLAAHDDFAIGGMSEEQCLRELKILGDLSAYTRPKSAKRVKEALEARLARLEALRG